MVIVEFYIPMLSPSKITALLRDPENISNDALEKIAALATDFPFFIPLQLLTNSTKAATSKPLSGLSGINPVLVYGLLHPKPAVAIQEEKPEITEPKGAAKNSPADVLPAVELSEVPVDLSSVVKPTIQSAPLSEPASSQDYFRQQGFELTEDLSTPEAVNAVAEATELPDEKSLLVMRSFSEWLNYYKVQSTKEKEEEEDRRSLRTAWKKEKLTAALEEEDDDIPEQVFEMAVSSIAADGVASESLASILAKQGKPEKAIDMYRKLSMQNPLKSAYFAALIQQLQQQQQSIDS